MIHSPVSIKRAASGAIWHVSREYLGIAEAGGVKDVVAGLSEALARQQVPVTVVLPAYGCVNLDPLGAELLDVSFSLKLPKEPHASTLVVEQLSVYRLERSGVRLFLIHTPRIRDKNAVYTYTDADEQGNAHKKKGTGHWDVHHINLTLQRGALHLARYLGEQPDWFHCHDGHSAFLPVLIREHEEFADFFPQSRTLITIHNAGAGYHQEIYDVSFASQLTGLPESILNRGLMGRAVDPLLLGAKYARVNTVSEQYAREIAAGVLDGIDGGLGKAYQAANIRLTGITNGIDPDPYDPRFPERTGLVHAFDPSTGALAGKAACRRDLVRDIQSRRVGQLVSIHGGINTRPDLPLYTFVGRLTEQKGVDQLSRVISELLAAEVPAQFIMMGEGERDIEDELRQLADSTPGRLTVLIGFDPVLAKRILAAGDFFLIPSLYEPCGLTDFYAQLLGNIPIVHRVGGLVKVREGLNGYGYEEHSVGAMRSAIRRSLADFKRAARHLDRMRRQAFTAVMNHHTWDKVVAEHYLPLYRSGQ